MNPIHSKFLFKYGVPNKIINIRCILVGLKGVLLRSFKQMGVLIALTFAGTSPILALAAQVSVPDAGALQQQIEREQSRSLQSQGQPRVVAPSSSASAKGSDTLEVRGFKFQGNKLLSSEMLSSILEPFRQKQLAFSEIEALTQVLSASYRAQGFLAFVVLPDQNVTDGIVTFSVIEAIVGQVVAAPKSGSRTDPQRLQALVAAKLPRGEPFRIEALDRALLLANDLPGVTVSSALTAGEAERSTDLILNVTDKPLWSVDATFDNAGSRSTGVNRLSLNLTGNGVMGLGDLWSASALASQGSFYNRLGLTFPVGLDGWRLGANASRMNYKIVDVEFIGQGLEGSSAVVGFEAVYPIIRKAQQNLYFSAALDKKNFINFANGTTASDYGSRVLASSLFGNRFDDFAGGGATSANLTLTQGQLALDGLAVHANDASTLQTAGSFRKMRYSLSRQQAIAQDLTLQISWSGQWASKNLDSSEKFALGGISGVRAYPSNEGMGAMGQLFNAELRMRWSDALALSAFYDTGSITLNARNNYVGASTLNAYSLSGAGLAMAFTLDNRVSAKLSWARRIGHNPNSSANGNDQNGTLSKGRLWASATFAF